MNYQKLNIIIQLLIFILRFWKISGTNSKILKIISSKSGQLFVKKLSKFQKAKDMVALKLF